MAIRCTHCGKELPRDDARFCNNCGTLVPSHSFSPQSPSASKSPVPAPGLPEQKKRVLREQIAEQPTSHVVRSTAQKSSSSPRNAPDKEPLGKASPGAAGAVPMNKPANTPRIVADEQQQNPEYEEVEQLDTMPLASETALQLPPSLPGQAPTRRNRQNMYVPVSRPSPVQRHRGRRTLLVLSILLGLLILSAIGAWFWAFQPLGVPDVTQPLESFKNTTLGVSLLYPNGWTAQVEQNGSIVHFYDSSHTGQANLSVNTTGSDVTQYVRQQVTKLGLTGAKAESAQMFAGSSWQRVQGNVQQNGVTYTETLFATVHGGRLFAFSQLAPQSIYTDEEQMVFSQMRSSFQFLS